MLTLRKEQMEIFRRQELRRFEDEVYAHLLREHPRACAALGEGAVRRSIRRGIERAGAYGITREPDVGGYIDLMYRLGHDFDTDPARPWARAILESPRVPRHRKVAVLRAYVEEHLRGPAPHPAAEG